MYTTTTNNMMEGLLPSWKQMMDDPFLMGWNVSAVTTVFVPLLIFTIARLVNEGDGEGEDDNDDNNRSWWKFWGGNNNDDEGENEQRSGDQVPWWWFWGEREREPESEGRGALIFVYVWSCLVFLGLVLYGNFFLLLRGTSSTNFEGLQAALIMFTNLAFMSLILVAGLGAIEMEGREIEETGWYGQLSVCVFLTSLFWLIRGVVFTVLLRRRNNGNTSSNAVAANNYPASFSSSIGDYYNMMISKTTTTAPSTTTTTDVAAAEKPTPW